MSHGIVASSGGPVIRVLPLVSGTPDTASLLSVLHLVTTQNKTYICSSLLACLFYCYLTIVHFTHHERMDKEREKGKGKKSGGGGGGSARVRGGERVFWI